MVTLGIYIVGAAVVIACVCIIVYAGVHAIFFENPVGLPRQGREG